MIKQETNTPKKPNVKEVNGKQQTTSDLWESLNQPLFNLSFTKIRVPPDILGTQLPTPAIRALFWFAHIVRFVLIISVLLALCILFFLLFGFLMLILAGGIY